MMAYDTNFWDEEWARSKAQRADMVSHQMMEAATEFSYLLLPSHGSLLDVGCGSGAQARLFSECGFQVTGVDISLTAVRMAKEAAPAAVIMKADAEQLPFQDGSFDVVYVNCMLMHCNRWKAIHECLRVLKKGGIMVLKEVKHDWLFSFPYRWLSPFRHSKPAYLTEWDARKLEVSYGFKRADFYLLASAFAGMFFISPALGRWLMNAAAPADRLLMRFMRRWAWVVVLWHRK